MTFTSTFRSTTLVVMLATGFAAAEISSGTVTQDDGLDVSDFLDKAYGFIPYAAPITEPAVYVQLGSAWSRP